MFYWCINFDLQNFVNAPRINEKHNHSPTLNAAATEITFETDQYQYQDQHDRPHRISWRHRLLSPL